METITYSKPKPFSLLTFIKHVFLSQSWAYLLKVDDNTGEQSLHPYNKALNNPYKLEKNINILATIAGAAPMIGFLGTVIGMIVAFHEMASAGGNIDVEMLSKGIYTAMVTTVAGLVVGIIAYISYNILVAKVEKVVFLLEATTTEFMDLLHNNQWI